MRAELSLDELKARAAFAHRFAHYSRLARREWEAANATRNPWERQQREEAAIGYERDLKGLVDSYLEQHA